MIYSLTWLPEVLLGAGLKVAQAPDWESRGRAPMGLVRGVMCHHTATGAPGNMPSLHMLIAGRPDLPGPLAQLGLGRDGTFYVIAAGRANHAGAGSWEGITTGNSSFIGIEAENDGKNEPWSPVQMEAYQRGAAAILKKLGAGANMCCGHKEYAAPHGRKVDPTFDMPLFRREVAAFLSGRTPSAPIPATDGQQRPTLRRGSKGEAVKQAQTLLDVDVDGFFGTNTEAALREVQRKGGLVPDGILGPKSWEALSSGTAAIAAPAAPSPTEALAPEAAAPALPQADTAAQKPILQGRTAVGPGGKRFAVSKGPGFFTIGETTLSAWLGRNPPLPPTVSSSVKNVVAAMSVVEGGLEAVNSYDDAHLSFGAFQWTAGVGDAAGELAVLLARFKAADPIGFQECLGQYGLDAIVQDSHATTGFLSVNGTPLRTSSQKSVLRNIEWAYRFWRAGHHESLRACEFMLAASRLDRFATLAVHGKPLREWMSSELAIALILDEHVNRPGHVPGTVRDAIESIGEQSSDPTRWSQEQEHKLIDAYLAKRESTTMTDSSGRAGKIEKFVRLGRLSDRRGSFTTA